MKPVTILGSLLLPCFALSGYAGELILNNGDVIHGELKSVTETSIVWSSDVLGDVEVDKSLVERFGTSTELPVVETPQGVVENCTIQLQRTLESTCSDDELALEEIVSSNKLPGSLQLAGDVKLGYNQKQGNTDSTDLDLAAALHWQYQLFRHDLVIKAKSDSSNDVVTDEKYELDYQLNYDFNGSWLTYGNFGYQKDRFDSIDEQYELGGGVGYRAELVNQLLSQAELGFVYLESKLSDGNSENDIAGKWALKFDWPIPGSNISMFHRHQLLWPIDELDNNQLESSTGLKLPLLGGVFSELRYDFDYTAQVTEGQEHADQEWVVSLGYAW